MLEIIGGPDRDRTDDLFHAMEAIKPQNIDGTVLMDRNNRQRWPNGRYLRAKCGQNLNQVAKGLIVWNQPKFSFPKSPPIPDLNPKAIYFRAASELFKPIRKLDSPGVSTLQLEFLIVVNPDYERAALSSGDLQNRIST